MPVNSLETKAGIYRYTMLPGLAELAAEELLTKKGYKATLFPQVGRFENATPPTRKIS